MGHSACPSLQLLSDLTIHRAVNLHKKQTVAILQRVVPQYPKMYSSVQVQIQKVSLLLIVMTGVSGFSIFFKSPILGILKVLLLKEMYRKIYQNFLKIVLFGCPSFFASALFALSGVPWYWVLGHLVQGHPDQQYLLLKKCSLAQNALSEQQIYTNYMFGDVFFINYLYYTIDPFYGF